MLFSVLCFTPSKSIAKVVKLVEQWSLVQEIFGLNLWHITLHFPAENAKIVRN